MKSLNYLVIAFSLLLLVSCNSKNESSNNEDNLSGSINIIHAGSLAIPVKQIADSFKLIHPNVEILTEAWGSKAGARRITDLNQQCDVYISADYKVIDNILIPNFADWNIRFAGNEMSIVFNEKSHYADEINEKNWCNILLRDDVIFARSDPNADPCGVRAVITSELAEWYYDIPGFKSEILNRHKNFIRPKETDLIAFLEKNAVDYIFLYRSVAEQHGLKYIILPEEVNLKNPALDTFYAKASVEVHGKTPNSIVKEHGDAMVYGITIPSNTNDKELAEEFVQFFLDPNIGQKIMQRNGQTSIVPSYTSTFYKVPESLKRFCSKENN